jgi:hypothetical protein
MKRPFSQFNPSSIEHVWIEYHIAESSFMLFTIWKHVVYWFLRQSLEVIWKLLKMILALSWMFKQKIPVSGSGSVPPKNHVSGSANTGNKKDYGSDGFRSWTVFRCLLCGQCCGSGRLLPDPDPSSCKMFDNFFPQKIFVPKKDFKPYLYGEKNVNIHVFITIHNTVGLSTKKGLKKYISFSNPGSSPKCPDPQHCVRILSREEI